MYRKCTRWDWCMASSNNNNARTHTHIDEQKYEMEGYTKISRQHNGFFVSGVLCWNFQYKVLPSPVSLSLSLSLPFAYTALAAASPSSHFSSTLMKTLLSGRDTTQNIERALSCFYQRIGTLFSSLAPCDISHFSFNLFRWNLDARRSSM